MPHVDIKCFPRDLNDEQKAALAEDIAEVIIRHFNSKDSSVSVALNQVKPGGLESAGLGYGNRPEAGRVN